VKHQKKSEEADENKIPSHLPSKHTVAVVEPAVQKEPAGQVVHAIAPAAEYDPAAQTVVTPPLQKLPAGQELQLVTAPLPAVDVFPSGQAVALLAPAGQYDPAGQVVHVVWPVKAYVPGSHLLVEPFLQTNPVGQAVHEDWATAPAKEVVPSVQNVRAVEPAGQYDPATQVRQEL
jgi:hypothetical protein